MFLIQIQVIFVIFLNFNNKKEALFNPIKMYLSVESKDIAQVSIMLFDFLEKNDILHQSKVASEVRSDDIVLRIYSKEDEVKIQNFINNNSYIRNSLKKTIQFCFEKDNIGYALDGNLSY